MRRFTMLRSAVSFLRQNHNPMVQYMVLHEVLRTMSPKACANAVFTALAINSDTSHWHFTHKAK